MPLIEKVITHRTAHTISSLLCLPCTCISALCCLLICHCQRAVKLATIPCVDDDLADKSDVIANKITLHFPQSHPKLVALKTLQWDAADLFKQTALLDPTNRTVYRQIRISVIDVLNRFNFGVIVSEDLTDNELKLIGDQLKEAIFSRLPSPEEFHRIVTANKIAQHDKEALNNCLVDAIKNIIKADFIKDQLNIISTQIEFKRSNKHLITATQTMFKQDNHLQLVSNSFPAADQSSEYSPRRIDMI